MGRPFAVRRGAAQPSTPAAPEPGDTLRISRQARPNLLA